MIAPDFTQRSARTSDGVVVWANHRHFEAEREQLAAGERHGVWRQKQDALWAQHAVNAAALLQRQTALLRSAVEWTYRQTGIYPHVLDQPDRTWAMGIPVSVAHRIRALICPVAGRITPELAQRLQDVVIFVESEQERNRIARACLARQRIVRLEPRQS